ncbi:MAG: lipid-A-disaccharide synthase [Myxococcota bacterium]
MTTILLSAGDQSGEMHGAALVRKLRERFPEARFVGLGGDAMRAAGVDVGVDQRELAVGGLVEVASSLPRVRRALRALLDVALRTRPDLVILIDSGGFNLLFARALRRQRRIVPTLYYIAPQVWAWRPKRVQKLAERADRIAVILPFERAFYASRGIEVDFVGHPSLDGHAALTHRETGEARAALGRTLGIPEGVPLLGIFPGSRRNEWVRHLPVQLEAFAELRERGGAAAEMHAVVGLAPSLARSEIEAAIADCQALDRSGAREVLHLGEAGDERVLPALDLALAKPGTITVEAMLQGLPMVVIAKGHPLSAWVARRAVQVDWLAMPNLIAGEQIVPELIQEEATPDRIAAELAPLLGGAARDAQVAALAQAKRALGEPGASSRVAQIVEEMLETDHA